ncbi:UBX domain-containing protein 11 isoform X1 [Micropterus dolomieu]|uniref:UBX domain-containing protein 11 isoform X1 n=1 Tax=Micropterus dolomieu TaxID=147949 RepID=UPI001E8CF04C|nr:UBX domain-containing protein 11 isoform X1 [Micropterus dolomieu]
MSSPLSMLKKTRRTPLQSPLNEQWERQKVPFRRNLLKEVQAAMADDDESSDPNLPPTSHSSASPASTSKSKAPLKKGAPPSDFELMSAMIQRVNLLEKTVKSQAQEIERKDKRISVLEEKLRLLKESEKVLSHDLSGRDSLERRCQQLEKQVFEMESFLNDYGLMWVGDVESSDSAEVEQPGLLNPDASVVRNFHMNFDLVLQRIKELNVLAGDGECFIKSTATGAQLAKKDTIRLSLYSNGIVMFDGPFRSYQEHSTQECMQDLMDGYFPSELQERFPDGVPFEVHDRRDEEFIFRLPWNTFPGEGQATCGEKGESSEQYTLCPVNNTMILPKVAPEVEMLIRHCHSHASLLVTGKKLSTNQFLNRLPKVVVKAGRVIDIRDSLRATLQGSSDAQRSNSVILIDTSALQDMKDGQQTLIPEWPSSARDVITTLKVKSEDGNHTYILKMRSSETIGHLRRHLDKHRGGGLPGYDIISAHPLCFYDDNCQTLQSCGLTTNATLLLRKRQHPSSLK